jgi:protein-S-isoprenylcysteine O-methyltransferase Ste14
MNKPKLLPPSYLLIALLAVPLLHFLLPLLKIIPGLWSLFGLLFILVGSFFELAAERLFHQIGTTVMPYAESQALVMQGAFRFSRNPMY